MDTKKITRFEVIDPSGRVYVKTGVSVELSLQDDGRTLKVFVDLRPPAWLAVTVKPRSPKTIKVTERKRVTVRVTPK